MQVLTKLKQYKTPLNFVNSTLFLALVSILTSFVTYRYISPEYLGIWATFSTFTTIATFLRLGIPNGMNRELPYYLGKGDKQKAYSFASTTLAYALFTMGILFLLAIFYLSCNSFSDKGDLSSSYYFAAVVFFITIIVEPYTCYLSGTFRTSENFDKVSKIQYIVGLARLTTIVLVALFSYKGFLVRELVITFLNLALYHVYRPIKIKPQFNVSIFKSLFTIGFSSFAVSYVSSFMDTIPRLYIIKECNSLQVGLFSPVLVIFSFVSIIPSTLASYMYPKFAFAYGKGCSKKIFWDKTKLLMLGSVGIGLVVAMIVFFSIDKLLLLFPKYINSASYIKIGCLGMAFIGHKVAGTVCVILKLYKWMWVAPICQGIVTILSLVILSQFFSDKVVVASYSLAITYCVLFFVSLFVTYYVTRDRV